MNTLAQTLLFEKYGIQGELHPLPGEIDLNFRVSVAGEPKYILKVASASTEKDFLLFQHSLIAHLSSHLKDHTFPQVISTLSGEKLVPIFLGRGGATTFAGTFLGAGEDLGPNQAPQS